jgi:DNA primase
MDFAEQVKSSVDIVRTIGEYVPLKKAGAARYTGLCPFHSERTPSFSVHAAHQFYKCFGCGVGGDVFKFVMEIEGIPFYEALKLLAERNGIPVPKSPMASSPKEKMRAAVSEMHEIAWEIFQANLRSTGGAEARAYLARRAVSSDTAAAFGLGLAEPSGNQLTRHFEKAGYSAECLEESGLVRRRPEGGFYDYFRGRLIFPIHSESGKVIAFGGRALRDGDNPKYLNSPETPLYHKSSILYNLHRARAAIRKQDRVILVEGYMDAIGVSSAGIHEVVASCGTALTEQQVRTLGRYSRRIIVNFDPDAAGANATERSLQLLLDENFRVRVLQLDQDLDPDEYVKEFGADRYNAQLESAAGYFHWLADRARRKFDMSTIEGRLDGWSFLAPSIERIPGRLERMAIANDVAGYLGVDRSFVLEQFRRGSSGRSPVDRQSGARKPEAAAPALERLLLRALVASEEARAGALPRLREHGLTAQFVTRGVFEALFAMEDHGGGFRFADLEARLSPPDQALLASICLTEEGMESEDAYDQVMECIRGLESKSVLTRRSALKSRITEAARAGNVSEALRLTQELDHLQKEG